ncbi:HIRAN domain-containing protein [Azovibrio restrictus]|uniref:HIRAN domain-containing protein n=1 Tax=Azovibrio restrictus TaxID=146938 RepID=UPI0026EBD383|nr:HIRAN domain-containing protein [Azovibrio restrictus]MDD3482470.1 HIRAN domain-containing protein [Azovibrio restrictus]
MQISFLVTLALLLVPGAAPRAQEGQVRLLVQASPLAGSQFHDLETLRPRLRVGDPLSLVREPENPHDPRAVRVEWQGRKLGYVPRKENRSVAAALDRGDVLRARISRLQEDPDPWRRLEFEVWMEL